MAEIDPAYREKMNVLAQLIDKTLNGDACGEDRKVGFTLILYPFSTAESNRCNYISNGAIREDIAVLFREVAARLEGQSRQSGRC